MDILELNVHFISIFMFFFSRSTFFCFFFLHAMSYFFKRFLSYFIDSRITRRVPTYPKNPTHTHLENKYRVLTNVQLNYQVGTKLPIFTNLHNKNGVRTVSHNDILLLAQPDIWKNQFDLGITMNKNNNYLKTYQLNKSSSKKITIQKQKQIN